MFPVNSTSVETPATARTIRVMQRTRVARDIDHAGVFACRKIAGSSRWSDHSWGAAVDLFPKPPSADDDQQRRWIMHTVVMQATRRTIANRGRKLDIRYVIDHDAGWQWTPAEGYRAYTGATGDHVHVSDGPAPVGVPPCA